MVQPSRGVAHPQSRIRTRLGIPVILIRTPYNRVVSSSNFPQFDRNPNTGHPFGLDAVLPLVE